jgi:tyrosine-protein phosphatase YwqE
MLSFFSRKRTEARQTQEEPESKPLIDFITTDIHSHLLPGIDDGAKELADSLALIQQFQALGYKKLITTPHIMGDFYRNTPAIIEEKLAELKSFLINMEVEIDLSAAAEYYLDEWFIQKIERGERLLTFGDNYVLFETGFQNPPKFLKETIFNLQTSGYKPVWAHPERYVYLHQDFKLAEELYERGVLLQINLNSLAGYYNKGAKEMAERLIDKGWVAMVGSDCHHLRHIESLKQVKTLKSYAKLATLPLLNQQL